MPTLAGDLMSRTEDATCCADLRNFKCGPGTIFPKAETAIDDIVRLACDLNATQRKNMIVRVTREQPPNSIVGLTGIERGPVAIQHPKFTPHAYKDAAYVAAIALSEHYRNHPDPFRAKDGGRLGDFIMLDALRYINKNWRGGMPWVLALVDLENGPSREMFERHDFELFLRLTPDSLFRRRKNLKVPA
jgi:hypothetical protein